MCRNWKVVQIPDKSIDVPELPQSIWARHDDLVAWMLDSYKEVVEWQWNLFMVPSGTAGKQFVNLLADLITAYCQLQADMSLGQCNQ